MIILKLSGGLGNQMFEYAAAYAFARQSGQELAVFKYDYRINRFPYELDDLRLARHRRYIGIPISMYAFATKDLIQKYIGRILGPDRIKRGQYTNKKIDMVKEHRGSYMPVRLDSTYARHAMWGGYWQTNQYFDAVREELLEQFQPNFSLSEETRGVIGEIQEDTYPVSVHVRRGDYVKIGWCVAEEYYSAAIETMLSAHPDARFYVFSDDIDYAKDLFVPWQERCRFVVHPKKVRSFEDMWSMSRCKGNIIVNSSYSWWGAYLNDHADKTVIVPSKIRETNNQDAICEGWIELMF